MDKIVNKGIDDFFEKWIRTTKLAYKAHDLSLIIRHFTTFRDKCFIFDNSLDFSKETIDYGWAFSTAFRWKCLMLSKFKFAANRNEFDSIADIIKSHSTIIPSVL